MNLKDKFKKSRQREALAFSRLGGAALGRSKSWAFKTSDPASARASTTYLLCDLERVSVPTSVKWEKQYPSYRVAVRLRIIKACSVQHRKSSKYTVA